MSAPSRPLVHDITGVSLSQRTRFFCRSNWLKAARSSVRECPFGMSSLDLEGAHENEHGARLPTTRPERGPTDGRLAVAGFGPEFVGRGVDDDRPSKISRRPRIAHHSNGTAIKPVIETAARASPIKACNTSAARMSTRTETRTRHPRTYKSGPRARPGIARSNSPVFISYSPCIAGRSGSGSTPRAG